MDNDITTERVVFLKDLENQGEIVAVFPDLEWANDNLTCYAHVGQHGECSRRWARGKMRVEAKAGEITALYQELTNLVGYNLVIVGKDAIAKAA